LGQADLTRSQAYHAFLWEKGVMKDLGTIGSDPCSRALMANSEGQIVGATLAVCNVETTHPFLWENGGPMVDLNTLVVASSGAVLYEADNINERGEIVASGLPAGCSDRFACGHIFQLTPCDEEHPDVEGCDYSMLEAAEVSNSAVATRAPQSTQLSKDAIARMMSASRNPFMWRYRLVGLRPAPSN
jgi:probable HAF family extracellular repeat protein